MIEVHWGRMSVVFCGDQVGHNALRLTFIGENDGLALGVTHLRSGSPAASRIWIFPSS